VRRGRGRRVSRSDDPHAELIRARDVDRDRGGQAWPCPSQLQLVSASSVASRVPWRPGLLAIDIHLLSASMVGPTPRLVLVAAEADRIDVPGLIRVLHPLTRHAAFHATTWDDSIRVRVKPAT
jgi:hypothetical protein